MKSQILFSVLSIVYVSLACAAVAAENPAQSTPQMGHISVVESGLKTAMADQLAQNLKAATGCTYMQIEASSGSPAVIALNISLADQDSSAAIQILNVSQILSQKNSQLNFTYPGTPLTNLDPTSVPQNLTNVTMIGLSFFPMTAKSSSCTGSLSLVGSSIRGSITCNGLTAPQDDVQESVNISAQNFECVPQPAD